MRRFVISLLLLLAFVSGAEASRDTVSVDWVAASPSVQETDTIPATYVRRVLRARRGWMKLIPNQWTTQFAGSIGAYSIGLGWYYGKRDNWETEMLFGYVPHSNEGEDHLTFTVKQRYVPWRIPLFNSRQWAVEPLTVGVFANLIFGEGFWRKAPSKYTEGYYGFNTKLRYNLFVGQRIRYNVPFSRRKFIKSLSLYYELSASDLHIVSSIPNKCVTLGEILSLAVGFRVELF